MSKCNHGLLVIFGNCVPDARVYDTCKETGIHLPKANNLENLIYSSSKIYKLFADLYDLPLFAYNDLLTPGNQLF